MPSLRLCSHIKTNGQKCASPALRHHTLCYFHYQWQRRDTRRVRLGGPIGMNKNSGIELPLLDGPEAILLSIMEIQRGLLDQRIPIKMGTALLYSLQLALQAKVSAFGLGHSSSVRECPELDLELEMERAKAQRPAKEKCAACPKREDCLSPRNCRKLPKVPGYHRVDNLLVRDLPPIAQTTDPSFRAEHAPRAAHLLQSADVGSDVVERPASRSSVPPIFGSSVASQLGTENRELRTNATKNEERGTKNPLSTDTNSHADNILGSKPNALLDLAGKFPQLAETKQPENQGVGVIAPRLERRG